MKMAFGASGSISLGGEEGRRPRWCVQIGGSSCAPGPPLPAPPEPQGGPTATLGVPCRLASWMCVPGSFLSPSFTLSVASSCGLSPGSCPLCQRPGGEASPELGAGSPTPGPRRALGFFSQMSPSCSLFQKMWLVNRDVMLEHCFLHEVSFLSSKQIKHPLFPFLSVIRALTHICNSCTHQITAVETLFKLFDSF